MMASWQLRPPERRFPLLFGMNTHLTGLAFQGWNDRETQLPVRVSPSNRCQERLGSTTPAMPSERPNSTCSFSEAVLGQPRNR
jgi:hypothetical protein